MASQKPATARSIAIATLNRFDPERNYAAPILNKLLHETNEKQRATDLVFGTIRNRAVIDMVIGRFGDCPVERIPAKLLNIIRIGVYELIYSPATPEYSIVNEAVESAKAISGKRQTGFVNAVLRQITRRIQNRQIQLSEADVKRTLPQTSTSGCEFDGSFLPVPADSPAEYFSIVFSLPEWLTAGWLTEFGFEKVRQICFASNRRPSVYIRPNRLKTATQRLAEEFRRADIDFEIAENESMLKIKAARAVAGLPGFAEGLFSVQDMTASLAVRLLQPRSGWRVLDLCAAPGVKTTQLAELTGDKAEIIATDIDGERLEKVRENAVRLGLNSIRTVAYEKLRRESAEFGVFDCVLVDVPCSNTGVLARRPEVRFRIKPRVIAELTKVQSGLLQFAGTMIKAEGKICYSTCSIEPGENDRLVRGFLRKSHNFKLELEKLVLPSAPLETQTERSLTGSAQGFDHDGGYVAIITGLS